MANTISSIFLMEYGVLSNMHFTICAQKMTVGYPSLQRPAHTRHCPWIWLWPPQPSDGSCLRLPQESAPVRRPAMRVSGSVVNASSAGCQKPMIIFSEPPHVRLLSPAQLVRCTVASAFRLRCDRNPRIRPSAGEAQYATAWPSVKLSASSA